MHYRFIATLDSYEQGMELPVVQPGRYLLRVKVDRPNFRPGAYTINVGVARRSVGVHLFYWVGAARFVVRNPRDMFLYADNNAVMHLDALFALEPADRQEPVAAPAGTPTEEVLAR
jgi:hypothetical protein